MARPAPDPRAVMAVFEARFFDGLKYGQLVEWTNGHAYEGMSQPWQWDPISRATVFNWYQQGLEWWTENERLSPDEEYAERRIRAGHVEDELVRQYAMGKLDVKTFAETWVKVSAEIRKLTGAGRGQAELGEVVTVSPRAQAAIDEMTARRAERERGRGRKGIGGCLSRTGT